MQIPDSFSVAEEKSTLAWEGDGGNAAISAGTGTERRNMKAFRMGTYIIAADLIEDAINMYRNEINGNIPENIEEIVVDSEIECDDGRIMTIKAFINEILDERQAWLRMGFRCELYRPFIIKNSGE